VGKQEVALLSKETFERSAELWHLRLGHLNFADMCRLKSRATGLDFSGEICFCQTCTMAKKRMPFQNKGHIEVRPKQKNIYVMMFQGHSLPPLTGSNIPSMPFVRRLENDGGLLEN